MHRSCNCIRKVTIPPTFHFVNRSALETLSSWLYPQIALRQPLWNTSSWFIYNVYGVHGLAPYKSVVRITTLYTWIFVSSFLKVMIVFTECNQCFFNFSVDLTTKTYEWLHVLKVLRINLDSYIWELVWAGGFCFTPLICFRVRSGWWMTSLFLILIVSLKALIALEKWPISSWAFSKDVAMSAASSTKRWS